VVLIVASLWACEENGEITEVYNEDLLFNNSMVIRIPCYEYLSEKGHTVMVTGDSANIAGFPDTLTSTPVLKWDSVGVPLIYAGIFSEQILITGGNISNTDDLYWAWHSGMNSGKDGHVSYSDGVNVKNGNYVTVSSPEPLITGNHYYWAVWAWNKTGTTIWYSSRPLEFMVSDN